MIDALTRSETAAYESTLTIRPDHIFVENRCFSEAGLIETIAQTSAAGVGYACARNGKTIPAGFIGAIQKLCVYRLPQVETQLMTRVTVIHVVENASVIRGEIFDGDQRIAHCEMNIFLQK